MAPNRRNHPIQNLDKSIQHAWSRQPLQRNSRELVDRSRGKVEADLVQPLSQLLAHGFDLEL